MSQSRKILPPGRAGAGQQGAARGPWGLTHLKAAWVARFKSKQPVLVFLLLFGLLLAGFYALTLTPLFKNSVFPAYLRLNARVSSDFLSLCGQSTRVTGTVVANYRFSVDIRRGCDAVEPTALFIAAVLAFPAGFKRKLAGVLAGTVLLAAINLVRIATLFLVGRYWPRAFESMHGEVWQALFIVAAIFCCAIWIQWATGPAPRAPHAAD